MTPYSTFVYGPNYGWLFEAGEFFMVTYQNGESQSWKCTQTDPAVPKTSSPSFKGKHCSYTVGCTCPGFTPTTGGDVWELSMKSSKLI